MSETSLSAVSPSPFRLLDLPTELRLKVYRSAITSGAVAILRICRLVNAEASPLVPSAGVLRIHAPVYGTSYPVRWPSLNTPPPESIRNIEIYLPLLTSGGSLSFCRDVGEDLIALLTTETTPALQRDTCHIVFRISILVAYREKPEELLEIIRKIKGFKRIVVTAVAFARRPREQCAMAPAIIRARNKPMYRMAVEELEPVFGKSVWHDAEVQEGRYLEFRPDAEG